MKNKLILLIIGVSLMFTIECKHEPLYPLANLTADSLRFKNITCNADTVYFYNDIGPLIISSCAVKACHDGNSQTPPTLTNYANIVKSVVPGQVTQSALYNSLVATGSNRMPLSPMAPFTTAQIQLVSKWIQQGAKNNGCSLAAVACDTTNVTYTGSVVPILQTYCTVCHSATSYASLGGGFKIATYPDFAGFAKSGLMMNSINGVGGLNSMPKGGAKLSACNIAKIGIVVRKILDSLNTTVCDTTNVTFTGTILPILQTYCLACHSTANAATLGAGYRLEALADFTAVAKTGLLMSSINQTGGISPMPKGGTKLSACNITKIGIMVRLVGGGTTPPPPPPSSCSPDTVYFTNTIGPLILNSCGLTTSRCHNTGGNSPLLISYANIRANVSPGNPAGSRLYTVLNSSGENAMPRPPVAPFTAAQKILVYNWILQGAKNNSCVDATCDTTTVSYSTNIAPIFNTNCIGCHSSAGSSTTKLDSYTGAKASVTAKRLLGAIQHLTGYVAMPPGGTLSACDIGKIKAWVFRGALNN